MSDFEQRRQEQESARRQAAASRDAERRGALAEGARAPSKADGTSLSSAAKVLAAIAGAATALMVPLGLLTWGTPISALALGGAVALGLAAVGALRFGRRQGEVGSTGEARLAALQSTVGGAPHWQPAYERARSAVRGSDLPSERAAATLTALEEAASEIEALNRKRLATGGKELAARTEERTAAFIANCDEIAGALVPTGPEAPSPADALEAIADHLGAEADARAELDEALRAASTRRVPAG
ncbi:MAG: hypothetical protein KDA24_04175 [Deltaproteobacteria bacterium]|nr:hypothetical protein [Deltaproteobacteria bacterium]